MANENVSLIIKAQDFATRTLGRVREGLARLRRGQDEATAATKRATLAGTTFKAVLTSLTTVFATYFSARAIGQFFAGSIRAFQEQEDAAVTLKTILEETGRGGAESMALLEQGATDLQVAFNVADEAVLRATARVARFAPSLNAPELAKAQKVLVALTETTGDLDTSGLLLGKTLGGQMNVLARYGIQIDTTKDAAGRLDQLLGSANLQASLAAVAARTDTASGRITAMKIAFNELQETIGGVIIDIFSVGERADGVAGKIRDLDKSLQDNRAEWVRFGSQAVAVITFIGRGVANMLEIVSEAIVLVVTNIVGAIYEARGQVKQFLNDIADSLDNSIVLRFLGRVKGGGLLSGERFDPAADFGRAAEQLKINTVAARAARESVDSLKDSWSDLVTSIQTAPIAAARGGGRSALAELGDEIETLGEKAEAAKEKTDRLGHWIDPERMEFNRFGRRRQRFTFGGGVSPDALGQLVPGAELPEVGGPTGFLPNLAGQLEDALGPAKSLREVFADTASNTLAGLNDTLERTFALITSGSMSAGEAWGGAFRGAAALAAKTLAQYYAARAAGELAEAVANPLTAPKHIAAAKMFFGAAALASAVAGAIGGLGGSGGSAGRGAGGFAAGRGRDVEDNRGTTVVNVYGGILDMNDPRQEEAFARAIESNTGRRVVVHHR